MAVRKMSERDTKLALSVLDGLPRRRPRVHQRRCDTCGLRYPLDELSPDLNEDGRQIGLVCNNCI